EWKGALVEPPGLLPGHRYPLVIQVYELHDHQFLTDGIDPTAMPARALAGAGILYLQVERRPALRLSESDASEQVEGMRSAIESLAKAGIVDPQKIGLIGFSWSCWYVETALIDHSFHIAAATIADGIDNSYMQFHLWGDSTPAIAEQFTAINGGRPFGPGLLRWLKTAP